MAHILIPVAVFSMAVHIVLIKPFKLIPLSETIFVNTNILV